MLTLKQRPTGQAKTKGVRRRPSRAFLQAIESREEADKLARELESRPLFKELLARSIVRKVHVRGFVPQDKYTAHMARETIDFVRRYQLDRKRQWRDALVIRPTQEQVHQWAMVWGVPYEGLRRVIRFLGAQPGATKHNATVDSETPSRSLAGEDESGDVIQQTSDFVSRYGLSQQDFTEYILSRDYPSEVIAERFGCSVKEAKGLLNVISRMEIIDAFREAESPRFFPAVPAAPSGDELVAEAWIEPSGNLQVRVIDDRTSARYLVNQPLLKDWAAARDNPEILSLLENLHAINEHSGALTAIVERVCHLQRGFIASGKPLGLRPLTQADVARQLGYNRSVVSRLVRGRQVQTIHGRYTMSELMPRTHDVIARLVEAYPSWSDSRIAGYLKERFDVVISRRSVNYHRDAERLDQTSHR